MRITDGCAAKWVDDHGEPGTSARGHANDVSRPQAFQGFRCGSLALHCTFTRDRGLPVLERAPQPRVLGEVAEMAHHGLAVARQSLVVAFELPGQPYCSAI